jgi:hypothetical protein
MRERERDGRERRGGDWTSADKGPANDVAVGRREGVREAEEGDGEEEEEDEEFRSNPVGIGNRVKKFSDNFIISPSRVKERVMEYSLRKDLLKGVSFNKKF